MSTTDWQVNWQEKTAVHKNGLTLKFTPREEFNRTFDISPREDREAVHQPEGWMRLVLAGPKSDRPQSVSELLPLLREGQEAFLQEAARHADA